MRPPRMTLAQLLMMDEDADPAAGPNADTLNHVRSSDPVQISDFASAAESSVEPLEDIIEIEEVGNAGEKEETGEKSERPGAGCDASEHTRPSRAKTKGLRINGLPSGTKIDLTREPDKTPEELPEDKLNALTHALGLKELSSSEEIRALQIDEIRRTLQFSESEFDLLGPLHDSSEMLFRSFLYTDLLLHERLGERTAEVGRRLLELADITHLCLKETLIDDGDATKKCLDLYFGGTENGRDLKQNLDTALGKVGEVYEAARELGTLLADVMEVVKNDVEIGRIAGLSMGGGVAQAFAATLQSRVKLDYDPTLVLLDPQLLNNAQAAYAVEGGRHEYRYDNPRGVAITLNYDKNPRRGLMNVMKGPGGYKSPGLVQLRLGLKAEDGFYDEPPLSAKAKVAKRISRMGQRAATPDEPRIAGEGERQGAQAPSQTSGPSAVRQRRNLMAKVGRRISKIRPDVTKWAEGVVEKERQRPEILVPPQPSGPPGLGYHSDPFLWRIALQRFLWGSEPQDDGGNSGDLSNAE